MLNLHKCGYGAALPQLYDSLYVGNPYGRPLLGLCYDKDTLVGQENYIRQNLASAGKLHNGALGINTLVDPKYRLFHGVFGKLCQLTIDTMKSQVNILAAFANEESKQYYLKYFKWNLASKVQVYKKVTTSSGLKRESILSLVRPGKLHKEIKLRKVTEFESTVLDPLIERHLVDSNETFFYKTSAFLNWKYVSNKHYKTTAYYIIKDNQVVGFCVTCDEGTEKKIVAILVEHNDIRLFESAVSSLAYLSNKQGMQRLVIYATPGCWYERCLKKLFFIKRWNFDFITRTFDKSLPNSSWVIHIGDFDIF